MLVGRLLKLVKKLFIVDNKVVALFEDMISPYLIDYTHLVDYTKVVVGYQTVVVE